jgi:hypothetical protein
MRANGVRSLDVSCHHQAVLSAENTTIPIRRTDLRASLAIRQHQRATITPSTAAFAAPHPDRHGRGLPSALPFSFP